MEIPAVSLDCLLFHVNPDALFSIVNFPNDACTTDSGDTGMCVASR